MAEMIYRCPNCGTGYVCQTKCGDIKCRNLSPVPVAEFEPTSLTDSLRAKADTERAREWFANKHWDLRVLPQTFDELCEIVYAYSSHSNAELVRRVTELEKGIRAIDIKLERVGDGLRRMNDGDRFGMSAQHMLEIVEQSRGEASRLLEGKDTQ